MLFCYFCNARAYPFSFLCVLKTTYVGKQHRDFLFLRDHITRAHAYGLTQNISQPYDFNVDIPSTKVTIHQRFMLKFQFSKSIMPVRLKLVDLHFSVKLRNVEVNETLRFAVHLVNMLTKF